MKTGPDQSNIDQDFESIQNREIALMDSQIRVITGLSWILVWGGFGVALVGLLSDVLFPLAQLNLYGDFVGGTVASIWALSGVLFIYSAFLGQKQQLLFQQIELRYSRAEMNATREELSGQKVAMERLNEINSKQSFESSFFQMLNIFHSVVGSIDIRKTEDRSFVTYLGRDCFQVFMADFRERNSKIESSRSLEVIDGVYQEFYASFESDLDHYFRYLYHIIKFIDTSKIKSKRIYIGIVSAQLSAFELALLAYNCMCSQGRKHFLPLAMKFGIFKDLNRKHLVAQEDFNFLEVEGSSVEDSGA